MLVSPSLLLPRAVRYPGTGKYDKMFEEGTYECAGCGTPLYKSSTKFNSGCGWPAFFDGIPGAINRNVSTKAWAPFSSSLSRGTKRLLSLHLPASRMPFLPDSTALVLFPGRRVFPGRGMQAQGAASCHVLLPGIAKPVQKGRSLAVLSRNNISQH